MVLELFLIAFVTSLIVGMIARKIILNGANKEIKQLQNHIIMTQTGYNGDQRMNVSNDSDYYAIFNADGKRVY